MDTHPGGARFRSVATRSRPGYVVRVPDPLTEPSESGLLEVGDGHRVYWEVRGNPRGKPALVVHGGPGSGATAWWCQFFDLEHYRLVLFDQRGCGRSSPSAGKPRADLTANTTQHLINDMERLRELLGIERWLLFGGSWGSTLSLAYAVEHPERVSEMVLWAVVTTRRYEVDWLTHTMGHVYPREFEALLAVLPAEERSGNIAAGLNRLLMSDDPSVHGPAALAWCDWEDRIATLSGPVTRSPRMHDEEFRLGFARLVTHYFAHAGFLPDDAIVGRIHRLAHIPAVLLRGRLDIASPLSAAWELARHWPAAELVVVEADAHGDGDDTNAMLTRATDRFASR